MHPLRLLALGAFIASMTLLCSCFSGNSAGHANGLILDAYPVVMPEKDRPPDSEPTQCDCTRSVPSVGVFCIKQNVQWYEGWLDPNLPAKKMRYWRATTITADGTVLQLIAGGISAETENDETKRGLVPPVLGGFEPGLSLEHCNGGQSPRGCLPECSKLLGGFLYVRVDPVMGRSQQRFWAPWPFVIRTKSIPAGAYSTKFVLLSVPDIGGGTTMREVVYRPNQESAACADAASPDSKSTTIVVAQPNDLSQVYAMSTVSQVEVTPQRVSQTPEQVLGADAQFLRSVCAFADRVMHEPWSNTRAKTNPCP